MKKCLSYLFLIPYLVLIFSLFFPYSALAVETEFGPGINNVEEYISAILGKILPLLAGVSLLMIIYAGFLYITSQGNPDRVNLAKDIITGVVTGILLLFLMKILLDQIG